MQGVPRGATSLTPYVAVPDPLEAAEFYRVVFCARVVELTWSNGAVVHGDLDFGNGHLHLEAPNPGGGLSLPPVDGTVSFALGFYCEDADAMVAAARSAGCRVLDPAIDFVSGDRFAAIMDPFGVRWSIMSRVEDLSEAESADRVSRWADQTGQDR